MSDERAAPRRAVAGPTLPPHLQRPKAVSEEKDTKRSRSRSPNRDDKREAWMSELPDTKMRADPLNIKSRQFIRRSDNSTLKSQKTEDDIKSDRKQAEIIRDYNNHHRSESLTEIYKREYKDRRSIDESKDLGERKFDWDRDMKQGTKGGSAKDTHSLMGRFGGINDRFSSGSSSKRFL